MTFVSWQPGEERIRQTIRSCRAERLAVIQYHLGMLKEVKLAGEFFAAPLNIFTETFDTFLNYRQI